LVPDIFQWVLIFEEFFNNGFEVFQDGGGDAKFRNGNLLIRDDSSSSKAYTNDYDVSSYLELRVHFSYKANGMESQEMFILEYSYNNGDSWLNAKQFVGGADFENN
jgi:hypothetical protein